MESMTAWISAATSGPAPSKDSASIQTNVPSTSMIQTWMVAPTDAKLLVATIEPSAVGAD